MNTYSSSCRHWSIFRCAVDDSCIRNQILAAVVQPLQYAMEPLTKQRNQDVLSYIEKAAA